MTRILTIGLLALLMTAAGLGHFADPEPWAAIVPKPLPPLATVYVSGVFEILGGIGLLVPRTRRFSAFGLAILFVAVFPANLYQWWFDLPLGPIQPPGWYHAIRLPFQGVLIAWALWIARSARED